MSIEIRREDHNSLTAYAGISSMYEVCEVIDPLMPGTSAPTLNRVASSSRCKDYDAMPGNHPRDWPARFAIERARFLGAYGAGRRVGGAVVIVEGTDVVRLGGSPDFALLWDIRVAPDARGRGIGRTLLRAAEDTARDADAAGMVIETQNVNVAACELYARSGYTMTKVDANAYPELPGEVQVIWTKTFAAPLAVQT
jgi:ribosomal protein S18 acetylase RimI-like enzyme